MAVRLTPKGSSKGEQVRHRGVTAVRMGRSWRARARGWHLDTAQDMLFTRPVAGTWDCCVLGNG